MIDKETIHFAAYGQTRTVCGLPVLRNGMPRTERWVDATCEVCLTERPVQDRAETIRPLIEAGTIHVPSRLEDMK